MLVLARRVLLRLLLALFLAVSLAALPFTLVHAADLEPLTILTKTGGKNFSIEMAKTEQQRATGLMYRKSLPEGQGMLFDFAPNQDVTMWMKNTYVSLDMIFIRADGKIHHIAERTTPLSETTISSRGRVRAVLEVVAGTAQKLGIAPGDQVVHPLFAGQ